MCSIVEIIGSWWIWSTENKIWTLLQAEVIDEKAILACIDAHPIYCSSRRKDDNKYPIHLALDKSLSMDVIRRMMTCYPQACLPLDSTGRNLLHHACVGDIATDIAILIIDSCHEAVSRRNKNYNLPLHIECANRCRYDVIIKLLEVYTESISAVGIQGELPLHFAIRNRVSEAHAILHLINSYPKAVRIMNNSRYYPLHDECMNQCRYEIIIKLLEIYPDLINIRCLTNDNLPLHMALYGGSAKTDIIRHLINLYPEATMIDNNKGRLPLHIICRNPITFHLVPMILSTYPQAVRIADRYNWLPFHHIFTSYYNAKSRYYRRKLKSVYLSSKQYRDVVVEVLDHYPQALIHIIGHTSYIQYMKDNHTRYRCLLNLAYHHISKYTTWTSSWSSPATILAEYTYIGDYHDMNWKARSPLLFLLLQLSSSSSSRIHVHVCNNEICTTPFGLLGSMVAATGKSDGTISYDIVNGDDLGSILLRHVMLYV